MDSHANDYLTAKLLLDTPPLVIIKELAIALNSLDKAVVLQQLHYLLWLSRKLGLERNDGYKFRRGRWWVYNSYDQWGDDHFPFWSSTKIGRIFRALEKTGIVDSAQLGKANYDRRKWYAINYTAFSTFLQKCTLERANLTRSEASDEDGRTLGSGTIMSETTPETTPKTRAADAPHPISDEEQALLNAVGAKNEETHAEFVELFGEVPPQQERQSLDSEGFVQAAALAAQKHRDRMAGREWANWGEQSAEAQKQFQRFGERSALIKQVGHDLENDFGLSPVWEDTDKVKSWILGIRDCLDAAEDHTEIIIAAAQSLRRGNLTLASPFSLVKTSAAMLAELKTPRAGVQAVMPFTSSMATRVYT